MVHSDDIERDLTPGEVKAIAALRRLAAKWPRTLMLASLDGDLVVLPRTNARFCPDGSLDPDAVIADITGIPNTGGAW